MAIPFLIIGLTGPWRAGCSTLGRMIERIDPAVWIRRKRLLEKNAEEIRRKSQEIKRQNSQTEAEACHKDLKALYSKRACLEVLATTDKTRFRYISVSSLILKLAVESSESPEYDAWEATNSGLGEIISEFRHKWIDTIRRFNDNGKSFLELDSETTEEFDGLLLSLQELRQQVTEKEFHLYINGALTQLPLQEFGDNLRGCGNAFKKPVTEQPYPESLDIVAREINRVIKYYRNRPDTDKRISCFVVDAFRNPVEVEYFRRRYTQFFLVSVYASEQTRRERFEQDMGLSGGSESEELFKRIDIRDWGLEAGVRELHKQNVSRCYYLSDVAINNDKNIDGFNQDVFDKFVRYYALIISPGCVQPAKEETLMNLAYSLSLRSSCISRKVGAVITDRAGFVLGLGWNDVAQGQLGCGLRRKEDLQEIDSHFGLGVLAKQLEDIDLENTDCKDAICFKDVISKKKIRGKVDKLNLSEHAKRVLREQFTLKRLEYCRSLHAEENALLQVSTRGGMGVDGGEIYTTTFPCELCAKKIYQSGIRRIYYTEPYPDSLSEGVFLRDGLRNIELRQFEGVKSFSYFRLYRPSYDKKDAQILDDL